jgi:hypothetical protein
MRLRILIADRRNSGAGLGQSLKDFSRNVRQALGAKPAGHNVSADPLFQDIIGAGILKDPKQRAVYQRLLDGGRQRLKTKSKRIVTTNAIAACLAILATTAAVGYAVLPPLDDTATIFAAPDDDNSPTDAAAAADSKDSNAATAATPASKEKKGAPLPAQPIRRTADAAITAERPGNRQTRRRRRSRATSTRQQPPLHSVSRPTHHPPRTTPAPRQSRPPRQGGMPTRPLPFRRSKAMLSPSQFLPCP